MHRLYSLHQTRNLPAWPGLLLIALAILLSGCVSGNAPKPQPYLRDQADYFMQAGITSYTQYNFTLAADQFNQAKKFYGRFDDYIGTTHALLNLAQVNLAQGRFDAAEKSLLDASRLIEQSGLKNQAAYRDLLLTTLYLHTDKLAEASRILDNYQQTLSGSLLDETSLSLLVNRVRLAQLTNQDFSVWLSLLLKQSDNLNSPDLTPRILRFQATQAYSNHMTEEGAKLFGNAISNYRAQANPSGLMATQLEWAQTCLQDNNPAQAADHYEQALHLALSNSHVTNGLQALKGLQQIYQQTGQSEKLARIDEWTRQLESLSNEASAP